MFKKLTSVLLATIFVLVLVTPALAGDHRPPGWYRHWDSAGKCHDKYWEPKGPPVNNHEWEADQCPAPTPQPVPQPEPQPQPGPGGDGETTSSRGGRRRQPPAPPRQLIDCLKNGELLAALEIDGAREIHRQMIEAGTLAQEKFILEGEDPAISPDGCFFSYIFNGLLWVASVDGVWRTPLFDAVANDWNSDWVILYEDPFGSTFKTDRTGSFNQFLTQGENPVVSPDGLWVAVEDPDGIAFTNIKGTSSYPTTQSGRLVSFNPRGNEAFVAFEGFSRWNFLGLAPLNSLATGLWLNPERNKTDALWIAEGNFLWSQSIDGTLQKVTFGEYGGLEKALYLSLDWWSSRPWSPVDTGTLLAKMVDKDG